MNFDEYGKRTDLIQKTLLEYCIDLLDIGDDYYGNTKEEA
jgi:hypothetical protein